MPDDLCVSHAVNEGLEGFVAEARPACVFRWAFLENAFGEVEDVHDGYYGGVEVRSFDGRDWRVAHAIGEGEYEGEEERVGGRSYEQLMIAWREDAPAWAGELPVL